MGEHQLKREQALQNLEEDVAVVDQRLQVAQEEDQQLADFVNNLRQQHGRIDSEMGEQQDRLSITEQTAKKAKEDIRAARGLDTTAIAPEELDLELQDTVQMNKDLLMGLTEVLN